MIEKSYEEIWQQYLSSIHKDNLEFNLAILDNILCIIIGVNMLWAGIVFILVGDYWNCEKEKKQNKKGGDLK